MCVCVYVCIHIYMHMYVYFTCVSVCVERMYLCTHTTRYKCLYMYMCISMYASMCVCVCVCVYIYIYTGCLGRNVPDFGRIFPKLKYTDITQNTYIRSWTVTEIITREKCGLLAVPRTVPGSRDVFPLHCACPSLSLKPAQAHSSCVCKCKVLGTLRTTAALVRVFM